MYAKLDRVLANAEWNQEFQYSNVVFRNSGVSGHSPGILHLEHPQQQQYAGGRFKFCNFWTQDPLYHELVDEVWSQHVDGILMYQIVQKLKMLKARLKKLHKSNYNSLKARLKTAKQELDDGQCQLQNDLDNVTLQRKEREHYAKYKTLANAELSLYKQKVKEQWSKEMDQNTAYFHARVCEKQARCRISRITDDCGQVVEDVEQIGHLFVKFYENLFGRASEVQQIDQSNVELGPKLTEQYRDLLCAEVTEEEIRKAVFNIDMSKAPGPDGYGSGFFRASWNIVGEDIIKAVKGFFSTGKLLKQVNNTVITLVPKIPCPNNVGDFRPIACCNTLYKIIAKIITDRLANVLPDIISSNQGAFVRDRSIMENILICQDIARDYHRDNELPRCMMRLDIRKAYDTIEWSFLQQVLLGLNFREFCSINYDLYINC